MKAMLLAAGRGSRLRPLTDTTPKPLLEVAGLTLIEHNIVNLRRAGIQDIVINLAYKGEQIQDRLGDGKQYDVDIRYSPEIEGGLETGGGIYHALPLLGDKPFVVLNSDFYSDFPYSRLPSEPEGLVHLVLVDTPNDQSSSDFAFYDNAFSAERAPNLLFAGIGVYRPELFAQCQPGKFSLTPLLREAIANGQATADYYDGMWYEIGTPERWQTLQMYLASSSS